MAKPTQRTRHGQGARRQTVAQVSRSIFKKRAHNRVRWPSIAELYFTDACYFSPGAFYISDKANEPTALLCERVNVYTAPFTSTTVGFKTNCGSCILAGNGFTF